MDDSTAAGHSAAADLDPAADQDAAAPDAAADQELPQDQAEARQQDSPKLTVAAVARRLGIAPATLRTWDRRYGIGPSDHATGHHRRYDADDVARLEYMQAALLRGASPGEAARYAHAVSNSAAQSEQAQAEPSGGGTTSSTPSASQSETSQARSGQEPLLLSGVLDSDQPEPATPTNSGGGSLRLGGAGPRARGLGRAALALDSWSAQGLLIECMRDDGVAVTRRDVLQPVMRALNERWQRTGSGVETLQLLRDSTLTALRSVIAGAPAPLNPRPVVLVSAPGEPQELDLVALAAALAANRVGHRLFAPALPKEGLDSAIRRAAPAAVLVWSEQSHYAAPSLIADIPNPRQRVRAFAGGPGWFADSVPSHVEVLGSWDEAVQRVTQSVLGRDITSDRADRSNVT